MLTPIRKIILPAIFFLSFFALYFFTASRSVYGGDVGDLVTAAFFGGVPHPPGYPFFTLIGFLSTHLFPFFTPAFAVGLISILSGALGVTFFYLLSVEISKSKLAAGIASCILGFSFLYWLYADLPEVFALNTFFAIFLFLLAIVYRQKKKKIFLFLFFFILGLSFTHHETIILIVPSVLLLIGKPFFSLIKTKPISLLYALCSMLLGMLPFIYIFIASSHHPLINWDNVHDIPSFFHLILRADYGTLSAGVFGTPSWGQRLVTLFVFGKTLLFQLTIPVACIVLIGLYQFFKKNMLLFVAVVVAWLLSGPLFLIYAGFPLTSGFIVGAYERFTLLSYPILLIPFATGLVAFTTFLARFLPKRNYPLLFQSMFFLIPLMLFFYNYPKAQLSRVAIGDTYAADYLTPLPPRAILVISGDTQVFNLWYIHYVEKVRPDILLYGVGGPIIDNNPIAAYIQSLPRSQQSEARTTLLEKTNRERPVFSTILFQPKKANHIIWLPYGLSFKMITDESQVPDEKTYATLSSYLWHQMHVPTPQELANPAYHNLTISGIASYYADSLVATGTFFYTQYQDAPKAIYYFEKAKQISPNDTKSYNALGILYATMPGKCALAIDNLSTSIAIDQFSQMPYFYLYSLYQSCSKNKSLAHDVSTLYTQTFHREFSKDLKNATIQFSDPLAQ